MSNNLKNVNVSIRPMSLTSVPARKPVQQQASRVQQQPQQQQRTQAPVQSPKPASKPHASAKWQTYGDNVAAAKQGKMLVVAVDLSKDYGVSTSGKSNIIASTRGNVSIDGLSVGINVYKPVGKPFKLDNHQTSEQVVGSGITMRVVSGWLEIELDTTRDLGLSSSGKSRLVASSNGNASVPGGCGAMVGVNVYRKA